MYYFVARSLVDRGYIVIIPDYRLYPEVEFPAFLHDSARAVAWTHRHLDEYVEHSENLYLAGHSAGAYNAAMVSLDERYLEATGLSNRIITGFIGLSGVYDFLPLDDPTLKRVFSGVDDLERTQPINFVDEEDPPALLISGTADERVDPQNSRTLHRLFLDHGIDSRLLMLEGVGHVSTVVTMGPYFREDQPTLDAIDDFVRTTRRPDTPN